MMRFLIAMLAVLLTACSSQPDQTALPPGATVLAFGDSVTAGVGAGAGEDYPTRLQALTGWAVVNAGVSGDTAHAATSRIDAVLEESRPALVLLEIGGNDFLLRRPAASIKQDIRTLIVRIRAHGSRVVLVAVPAPSLMAAATGSLDDAALYAELATEEDLPLIDNVFAEVLSDPRLRADAIHPNRAGYEKLASGIAAALAEQGLLRRR